MMQEKTSTENTLPSDEMNGSIRSGGSSVGHLGAIWCYYMRERRILIPSMLSPEDSLRAVKSLSEANGICVQSSKDAGVIVNSTRHYGKRGRPLIPFLRGRFRSSSEGVKLDATISIEPCARAMIILFWLVILMAWIAICGQPTFGHVMAGVLTTGIFWCFMEVGYWIGWQDIRHIVDQVSMVLTAGHNNGITCRRIRAARDSRR
jgi:hypothetical protein